MFGFLQSENSKLRSAAKNWLYLGAKVYNYRRDELSDKEIAELDVRMGDLRAQLKAKPADAGKLSHAIEAVEGHMRKIGGAFYPQSSMSENIDFALYFLILYLGFTAFFIKPFKIPTNSMWPTYNGMTSEVWTEDNPAPGAISRAFRTVAFGAMRQTVEAPADGELLIPVQRGFRSDGKVGYQLPTAVVSKRHHLIVPGKGIGYVFEVGGEQVLVKVPQDFDLESVMPMLDQERDSILGKAWFPGEASFDAAMDRRWREKKIARSGRLIMPDGRAANVQWIRTGLQFKKGETLLSFDLHTGDQLFVDRMSYHFVAPEVGDGFVFRTGGIRRLAASGDKYYIKRLAGTPGDRMRIENDALLIDGEPAAGSIAFDKKRHREPPYDSYSDTVGSSVILRPGEEIQVPEDSYVALGDNSNNSYDSRGWGYVPEPYVVGRPIMIFYPFTQRFGLAK